MDLSPDSDRLPDMLRETVVALVADDRSDLTARQLAVFLICFLDEGPHTVRGLAARLDTSRPAISRVIDTLAKLELVARQSDPLDGRSILVGRTIEGAAFLSDLHSFVQKAATTVAYRPFGQSKPTNKRTS